MKKIVFAVLVLFVFTVTNAFALGIEYNEYGGDGGDGGDAYVLNAPVTSSVAGAAAAAKAEADAKAYLNSFISNKQQVEVKNTNIMGLGIEFKQSYINERELMVAAVANYLELPIYQNGVVGNYNNNLPAIYGLKKLKDGEEIDEVVDQFNGIPIWRYRLEEVVPLIVKIKKDYVGQTDIRFVVWYKGSVVNAGISSSTTITASMDLGLMAGNSGGAFGYGESTTDPKFYIHIVRIKEIPINK